MVAEVVAEVVADVVGWWKVMVEVVLEGGDAM